MNTDKHPLRLNVGFIIHEEVGYSRDFEFNFPQLKLDSDFEVKALNGIARFSRTPQGLLCEVQVQGDTEGECVRCLEGFDQSLATKFTELFAFDERSETESELILPEDGFLDLAPLVREYLLLEIPQNPVCKPDCLGLCEVCGNNLNKKKCNHKKEKIDPRLSVLKDLLDENK